MNLLRLRRALFCVSLLATPMITARGQDTPAEDLAIQPSGGAQANSPPLGEVMPMPIDPKESSYALGLNFGNEMRQNGVQLELQSLMAGISDALTEQEPKLTPQRFAECMESIQTTMQEAAEKRIAAVAQANLKAGQEFLEANRKAEGIQTTPSGLQFRVLKEGAGQSPTPRNVVECHYEGKLLDGTVFDSSYQRGKPAQFPVGGVISGWTEVLQLMKPGEVREVVIPSELGYGEEGTPGGPIGPNQTLLFKIELIGVVR